MLQYIVFEVLTICFVHHVCSVNSTSMEKPVTLYRFDFRFFFLNFFLKYIMHTKKIWRKISKSEFQRSQPKHGDLFYFPTAIVEGWTSLYTCCNVEKISKHLNQEYVCHYNIYCSNSEVLNRSIRWKKPEIDF